MYFTLLFSALAVVGYLTGWLFIFWLACSICSLVIWIGMYHKSISDYAYLAAERWQMLILFDEVRAQGFDGAMNQRYYFLNGMRTHWIVIASYIKKLYVYSMCQTSWVTRQWIAKMPPDLATSLLELETQRELYSAESLLIAAERPSKIELDEES